MSFQVSCKQCIGSPVNTWYYKSMQSANEAVQSHYKETGHQNIALVRFEEDE